MFGEWKALEHIHNVALRRRLPPRLNRSATNARDPSPPRSGARL